MCWFQSLSIQVVSDAFLGLSVLKRHQLVYLTLGDDMNKVRRIFSSTPRNIAHGGPNVFLMDFHRYML